MKSIYVLKIHPKEFVSGLSLIFRNKPFESDVRKEITRQMSVSKSDQFKSLCSRCLTGISIYGMPVIREGKDEGIIQWKFGGESEFSSKGYTAIKVMEMVEN